MDGHVHFLGLLGGVGAVGFGYLLSRISVWTSAESDHLKSLPKYYNFSQLQLDLNKDSNGSLTNVFVQGTIVKQRYGSVALFSDKSGLDGAAKLVTTANYSRVYNHEKQKWDERVETIVNQCLSVPFELSDRHGNNITIENVHNASNFKQILYLVDQRKFLPEQRTVGDIATNMILHEIPNGSLTKEFLLLFGTDIAALGDAIQTNGSNDIVFYPQEVGSSISYLIYHHELIAKIERVLSTVLILGGSIQIIIQLWFLYRKRKME